MIERVFVIIDKVYLTINTGIVARFATLWLTLPSTNFFLSSAFLRFETTISYLPLLACFNSSSFALPRTIIWS